MIKKVASMNKPYLLATGASSFEDVISQENTLQDKGFTELRSLLMDRINGIGSQIIVRTTNETLSGVFSDLNKDGHLILNAGRTKRAIAAADVYFD